MNSTRLGNYYLTQKPLGIELLNESPKEISMKTETVPYEVK